ncbi:hypothetical protein LUZ61_007693 [Rhynchospora tenuis]|uniref:Integrase catalytic domain-containing protein n=1 Tax=Rhynchospora tenuis TaxID=198213 RepID=A0AAD5ZU44_9POAL|nr:hypothetical protein LUZ61_007693 [Rhynchospora tenuis]
MATTPNTSSTLSSISSTSSDSIIILNLPIATKLTRNNFLAWQSQIVPLLHGYDLFKFLDASSQPNPIIQTDTSTQVNPEYVQWKKQDQMLLGWLRSSLSESLLAQVVSCTTTAELWSLLQSTFSASSQARLIELQQQLQGIKKGGSSCADYIQKLRSIADELAFIGSPVSDREMVNYTLRGLGSDFDPLVLAVTARSDPISLPDLHGLLLTSENRLAAQHTISNSLPATPDPTAFYTNPRPRHYNPRPVTTFAPVNNTYRPRPPHNNSRPMFQNYTPRPTPYQPRSPNYYRPPPLNRLPAPTNMNSNQSFPPPTPAQYTVPCQICGLRNHQARNCYHRFSNDSRYNDPPQPSPRPSPPQFQAFVTQPQMAANPHEWCIDSGATHHVTADLNNLSNYMPYTGADTLHIGNGMGMQITHIGSSLITVSNFSIALNDILLVPNFSRNLLSLSRLLLDNTLLIEFSSHSCLIKDRQTKIPLLQATLSNGLYLLHFPSISSPQVYLGERVSADLWHARFGHPSSSTTLHILHKFSLPCSLQTLTLCNDCCVAKSQRLPFISSDFVSTAPLELVHSDLWGPSPIISKDGFRYYVIFVDDFTHYTWIYFLKTKDELSTIFTMFKQQVETLLNHKIKILRTDGGAEFKPLSRLFPQITHQITCPYTPQQNGLAERMHRHVVSLSLATISKASIPLSYWDEIFASVVYLINRLPTTSVNTIPYQKLFNHNPDFLFLKVLGCLCYPYTRPYNDHKLQMRSIPCVFIGYAYNQKGYKCLDLATNRIYVSRHVVFNEQSFPFSSLSSQENAAPQFTDSVSALPLT